MQWKIISQKKSKGNDERQAFDALDEALLRSGNVVSAPVPGQRNVVTHKIVVAFDIGRGEFYLHGLGHVGAHAEPASCEHGDGDTEVCAENQDKLRCERSHDRVEAGDLVEGVGRGVSQVNQLERQADDSSADHEHRGTTVGAGRGSNLLVGGPQPGADGEHDEELQAVTDLVQAVVDKAAFVARGSSVGCHADTRSVHEMSDAQNDLLGPSLR